MSVYALAMACVLHGSCQRGYFLVKNPALVSCERDVLPMIDGHGGRNRNGETIVWRAEGCTTQDFAPKNRRMMGMF